MIAVNFILILLSFLNVNKKYIIILNKQSHTWYLDVLLMLIFLSF